MTSSSFQMSSPKALRWLVWGHSLPSRHSLTFGPVPVAYDILFRTQEVCFSGHRALRSRSFQRWQLAAQCWVFACIMKRQRFLTSQDSGADERYRFHFHKWSTYGQIEQLSVWCWRVKWDKKLEKKMQFGISLWKRPQKICDAVWSSLRTFYCTKFERIELFFRCWSFLLFHGVIRMYTCASGILQPRLQEHVKVSWVVLVGKVWPNFSSRFRSLWPRKTEKKENTICV